MSERTAAVIENGKIANMIVIAADAVLKATEIEYSTIIGAMMGDAVINGGVPAIAVRIEAERVATAAALVTATANEALQTSARAKLVALGLSEAEIAAL